MVREALDRGARVTAIVRSNAKRPAGRHDQLSVVVGDPCDPEFLATVFRGQDAVISTLGGRRPTRKAASIYYMSADAIAEAALNTGLKKGGRYVQCASLPSQATVGQALDGHSARCRAER